jgi:cation:H+ antiporter
MLLDLTLLAMGALALAFAGDRLVDFAAAIAEKARLTPAVIGLTIVAAGTSAPELVVSVIAIGNVVGSNIANIGLVLAACAVVAAVPVAGSVLRFEYPFLLLVSWIALLLSRDGLLDRLEAAFFVASMAGFVAYAIAMARRGIDPADTSTVSDAVPAAAQPLSRKPTRTLALGLLAALAGLMLAGQVFVAGAMGLAQLLGVSERVIGLTVVAVGTSLPELAVSLAAAMKKQQEMAVANIVGSNVFNLLMILGIAGLVRPLSVDGRMVAVDMWVMMGFAVLLLPLVYRRQALSRAGGACLLAAYACYVAWLAVAAR